MEGGFPWARIGALSVSFSFLILLGSVPAASTEQPRFRVKLSTTYEQGKFGTVETTRTLFVPLTLQYLGDQFDLGVTVPFIYQETGPGVVAIEGAPQPCSNSGSQPQNPCDGGSGGGSGGEAVTRQTAAGLGDIVVKGRYYLVEDRGPFPQIAPFAKVKFPTADDAKGLGTGELDWGFGVELEKRFDPLTVFGDIGYTFIGDPANVPFRDKISGRIGIAYALTQSLSPSVALEWSRALVAGADDPLDLVVGLDYKVTPATTWSLSASVGLSDGSPDFGVTVGTAVKF